MSVQPMTAGLICPKCGGQMRAYERSGITVDQCAECRGVFLDRGELERLIDAEGSYYQGQSPASAAQRQDEGHGDKREGRRKERFGFLGELFGGE
jgi:Zn-finger nucleic acid-binding protein